MAEQKLKESETTSEIYSWFEKIRKLIVPTLSINSILINTSKNLPTN